MLFFLEQREVAFLSPSKICENLNFSVLKLFLLYIKLFQCLFFEANWGHHNLLLRLSALYTRNYLTFQHSSKYDFVQLLPPLSKSQRLPAKGPLKIFVINLKKIKSPATFNCFIQIFIERKCTHPRCKVHTTYSWNIKWQKCAGMGLIGFIFKKINEN